ncbi:MAG: hypothetical protein LBB73_07955 [Dysgonamonadaceae bacterium]|jgi:hypothetical protein|nr:hypothetical protein [Dysgonamonadaceae bacterium]
MPAGTFRRNERYMKYMNQSIDSMEKSFNGNKDIPKKYVIGDSAIIYSAAWELGKLKFLIKSFAPNI